jgi:hypothetical protein
MKSVSVYGIINDISRTHKRTSIPRLGIKYAWDALPCTKYITSGQEEP